MTTQIEIDQATADMLTSRARASGLSLAAYLRSLAEVAVIPMSSRDPSLAEFDQGLDQLAADLPPLTPLPAGFSRRDIYVEHD